MKTLLTLIGSLLIGLSVQAQCAFDNTYLLDATPACPGTFTVNCMNGGQYVTVNVVAGNVYTFTTCGNAAFDTQITVYDAPGATVLGYNDDDCGVQSTVTWTATYTGTVNVLVDEYFCNNTGLCTDLIISCDPPIQNGNGCNTNTTICTAGVAGPFGFSTPGNAVSSCLDWISTEVAYIVLYVTASGPLEMLINGDATSGFLDIAVFNVPAGMDPCVAAADVNNEIGCSYAQTSTGCNQMGQSFPCTSFLDPTLSGVPGPGPWVNAGDVLFIVVENWLSGGSTNFTLELAPPPAAQTGPPDPTITAIGPFCDTDPAIQMDAVNNGGTWTGTGVSPSGLFDPAAAGPGTYTIDYSIGSAPCDAQDQTTVTVIDCSSPCFMNYIDVTVGACDPNDNTFDLSGEVQFTNAPTTGNLIIEDCNGNQQVVACPVASPFFYSIPNLPTDGTVGCSVTAYFTADPGCTLTTPTYDNPTGCMCSADAGTYSEGTIGNTNSPGPLSYDLCFGDQLDLTALGDYTAPDDYTGVIAATYDPGIWLLVYDCPPTVTPPTDINTDPCLLGIASTANGAWSIINNAGDGSTLWFVPVTMYSMVDGIYAISINGGDWCYDLGPTYEVTYLEDITTNLVEDCQAGTATVTVSGGQPANDGSNFTASNLVPGSAAFGNTTTGNGGTITVTGLQDGDNYSFDITDGTDCFVTVTGTFVGTEDPSFTYPSNAYCEDEPNPSPTITGVTGGTFASSPAGLSINPVTGVINLGASTPSGPYTVTYTTPDAICFDQATFDITVNPLPIVDGNDVTICAGDMVTLNGTGADTYIWDQGVTNNNAFVGPAVTTTYNVTGTITATGCSNTGTSVVTVNPQQDASFTTTDFCEGTASPAATITGTPGGTFSYSPDPGDGSSVNAASGSITNGVGGTTYTIDYTTPGPCPASMTQTVTVNALPPVDVPDYSVCTGGTITLTATGATAYSWSPGTDLNGTVGASVDFTAGTSNVYTVTGTDANGCVNTDVTTVTVIPNAPINAGPDVTICLGDNTTLTASGGVTYNWQAPISAAGASQVVSPAATTIYTVDGVDAQGCTGTDQVTVTVNPLPVVDAGIDQTVCEGTAVTLSGAGAAAYVWDNGVVDGASFTPAVGTVTYTVTGTDGNGCVNTDQVDVTVNPLPIVNAGADQTMCEGVMVTLSGSGATNYAWDNGVMDGVAFNAPIGATTTYMVTGTDANGCIDTDQVDVTVNALPVVSAGPDQTVCDGVAVTLSGTGATNYVWDNGVVDGASFTPAIGSVTYTVVGTDANGCIDSDNITVTVNPNPSPIINGATTYCTGTFSTLSTASPYTTYSWSTGAATPTVNVTDADNPITVTVTNAFGCSGTSPVFTVTENNVITYNSTVTICQGDNATIHGNVETVAGVYTQTFILGTGCDSTSNVTLVVNPLPAVNAGLDQTVCEGVATTLIASGASVYVWDNGVVDGQAFTQAVGTVTYTLTGTDANGCVNTDQVDIAVNPLPVVNAGPDQTVCEGTAVTLAGSGASTYAWNNGVTDNQAFTPAVGTLTYTVTGTDVNGCISTDQADITVNALPNIGAGLDQTVCEGTSVTLSGSGAATYIWDNGVTNGLSFTPAVGTLTYTVTGTDGNGCVNTDAVDVTVNPLPVVDAGPDQSVCDGVAVTLTGSGASTYAWTNGVTDGAAFAPAVGTLTYTVTGTDANGCVNTDQVDVTVNALPVVDAGPDQTVCEGTAVTLSASGVAGGAYVWDNGITDGQIFTPAVGTVTYTVIATDANGCVDSDQVDVTATPIPVVFAGNDVIICAGEQVTLTGSGAQTYVWDNGVINGTSFSPTGTAVYTVVGTDANGCVDTDDVTVTVEPLPVVSFTADVTSGCAPLTVTFTNTTAGNLTDCIWTLSNGAVLTGCGDVTTTFPNGGLYDVTLTTTSANGCTNSTTYADYIYVEDSPIAAFNPSSTELSTFNTEIHFDNTSSGAVDYLWDFGDESATSTAFEPLHVFPDEGDGTYVIQLIAYSPLGCPDTTYRTIVVNEELIFYVPNTFTPDNDDFNETFKAIFTSGYDPFDFTLLIFNRWGEIIWESHDVSVGWDGTYGGSNEVQDGTYTWKIEFKTTRNDKRISVTGHVNVMH